jgi:hypothetical protein
MQHDRHWVGTWTTAPAPAEGAAFSNHTLRMNVRASIGGDTLRVRLSNAHGSRPLAVGAARVGLRDAGPGFAGPDAAHLRLRRPPPPERSGVQRDGGRDRSGALRLTQAASALPLVYRRRDVDGMDAAGLA